MPNTTALAVAPALRLRPEAWYRATARRGLTTDTARADALGMDRVTVNLVANQRRYPGEQFIAAVVALLGWAGASEVFELVEDVAA